MAEKWSAKLKDGPLVAVVEGVEEVEALTEALHGFRRGILATTRVDRSRSL
jgi:hypothetical protein